MAWHAESQSVASADRCLSAPRSRVRHSYEVGHRVRGGSRYPLLAAKRALSASELHGSAPRDKVCGSVKTRGGQYVDGVHQNLDVHSRASDPSKPYTHLRSKRGRHSCSRGCWDLIRSTEGSCCDGQTHHQEHHGSNPLSSTRKPARTALGSRRPQSLDYLVR
jgi:hypothetical protein